MNVYQIFRCEGCYEDYHKILAGAYLSEKVAHKKLVELVAEADKEFPCSDCPYSYGLQEEPIMTDCPRHTPYNMWAELDSVPEYDCQKCVDDYDKPSYVLETLVVDESEDEE